MHTFHVYNANRNAILSSRPAPKAATAVAVAAASASAVPHALVHPFERVRHVSPCCAVLKSESGGTGSPLPHDSAAFKPPTSISADVIIEAGSSDDTDASSSSSNSSSGPSSNETSSSGVEESFKLMTEISNFMDGFSEAELAAAFASAAEAMEQVQQQQQQQQQQQGQQAQQQQQQQPKIPATAMSYLRRVMEKAAEKGSKGGTFTDPAQYLSSEEGHSLLWEVLKDQFTADEVKLLSSVFGSNWQLFGGQMDPSHLLKLAAMGPEEVMKLGGVLNKMSVMSKQMDALVAQMPTASTASQSSSTSSRSNSSMQQPSARAWGASFRRPRASSSVAGSISSNNSQTHSQTNSMFGREQSYSWDVPLAGGGVEAAQRVHRLLVLSGRTLQQQQQQWGIPASQQFQMLTRLYQQMVQLEAAQLQEQQQQRQQALLEQWPGIPVLGPEQAEAVYATISAELNWLVRQVADEDIACRSSFWYMHALFDDSWQQQQRQQQQEAASIASGDSNNSSNSRSSGIFSGAESSSSRQQQQQQQQLVTLDRLESLGMFLAAAGNLEALRAWGSAFLEARPHMEDTEEFQELAGLLDDDWFIKLAWRSEALAATQAAAAAAAAAEAQASTRSSGSSSTSQPVPSATPSAAAGLSPDMVDSERIEQLAALDSGVLWFLAEMEVSPEPQQTLLKWALHPTVGPKLQNKSSSSSWLQQLHLVEPLLSVYSKARVVDYMAQMGVAPL